MRGCGAQIFFASIIFSPGNAIYRMNGVLKKACSKNIKKILRGLVFEEFSFYILIYRNEYCTDSEQ
jgi:hypothetical protein